MPFFDIKIFHKEFLCMQDDEFEFFLVKFFGENFTGLARETRKMIISGEHDFQGSTGEKLVRGIPNGEFILAILREIYKKEKTVENSQVRVKNKPTFTVKLKHYFTKGFTRFFPSLEVKSHRLFSYLSTLDLESRKLAICIQNEDIKGINQCYENMALGDFFWKGIDQNKLLNIREHQDAIAGISLRAQVYTLALYEHVFLSLFNSEIKRPSSQISFALNSPENPYLHNNEKPLQKFFCTLFHDPSIESIAERIRKQMKPYVEADGYRRSFRKKLSADHLFSFKEADKILTGIFEKHYQETNDCYPSPIFWLVFVASRAFHRVWLAYEVEKNSGPLWKQALPNGPETLFEFYDQAYTDIAKKVA